MPERQYLNSTGSRILIILPSGTDLAEIIRAAWDQGRTLALLKPSTAVHDQRTVVRNFKPHAIVTTNARGQIVVSTRPIEDAHPSLVEDGSITVFTSGTTGPPKGVVIPRAALIGNALKTATLHGIGDARPHGTCLALYHVNALVMSLLGTHLTGEQLLLADPAEPVRYFAVLRAGAARTASVNPVELRRIVAAAPKWPDSLDYLITAAGPCSAGLAAEFYKLYGPRLRQGYGMSEAVNFSFVMPLLDAAEFKQHYLKARPPIGLPLPDTTFNIEDDELRIHTPDRMLGYLGGIPSVFDDDGWLCTGDCAVVRDGFVVLRGRKSDVLYAAGGRRVLPADMEDQLALPAACGEYAVAALRRGAVEDDGAALYLTGGWVSEISEWLLADVRPVLCFIQTERLLLSGSGKVQRYLMSEESTCVIAALTEIFHDDVQPDPERLATVVRQFLGLDPTIGEILVVHVGPADLDVTSLLEQELTAGATALVVSMADRSDPPMPDRGFLAAWQRTDLVRKACARLYTPAGEVLVFWGARSDGSRST